MRCCCRWCSASCIASPALPCRRRCACGAPRPRRWHSRSSSSPASASTPALPACSDRTTRFERGRIDTRGGDSGALLSLNGNGLGLRLLGWVEHDVLLVLALRDDQIGEGLLVSPFFGLDEFQLTVGGRHLHRPQGSG